MHKNRGFAHVQFLRKFPFSENLVADGFEAKSNCARVPAVTTPA